MPPLAEAAPEMGDKHLSHRSFIANNLHQLINTILFEKILSPLLLERKAGVQKLKL
jgi:hypothetical protein